MKKFLATSYLVIGILFNISAQTPIVKGRVLDTFSSEPVFGVTISILGSPFTTTTNGEGLFLISDSNLPNGEQVLIVTKESYVTQRIPITVQEGGIVDLNFILLVLNLSLIETQIGVISLSEDELNQDEGSSFNISGLLQASRDVFLNAAAYDFSSTFFRPRGLNNGNGKVLINGLLMNKFFSGRPQWGNWGGLNDVQRNREFSMGLKPNDYAFGDIAGTTNIIMRASKYRKGGRVSYAMSNRSYTGRVMGSYGSGLLQNGWSYSLLVSRRFGKEGYIDGTSYDANSFFVAVEKKLSDEQSLNLAAFFSPNERGRSTAITQEVRDLKGIRYNPNWGYQDKNIRNSRTRKLEEPVIQLNHFWDISEKTKINTNIGYQFGSSKTSRIDNNGTRLISTDTGEVFFAGGARNPLPNYYQNLPSYILRNENPSAADYQRAFLSLQDFLNSGQIDWNSLYEANLDANGASRNSTYVIQNDVVENAQLSANTILNIVSNEHLILNGNIAYRNLKSINYAEVKDLLGGAGYLDIDSFAEAAAGDGNAQSQQDLAQSNLQNPNRIALEGDRYKYNYALNAHELSCFAQAQFKYRKLDFYAGIEVGSTKYQRDGLYENGNYPGNLSFGESEELAFSSFGAKGGMLYKITGRQFLDINAGYIVKAPSLRNSFSNARQNNATTVGIEEEKIRNVDVSYIYRSPIAKARLTTFYSTMEDQSDLGFYFTENISGLGIEQDAFVQEVLTNISTKRIGLEFGVEAQITPTVKLKGAASVGEYTYNNNPNIYITSDDFTQPLTFGDGTAKLKNYHIAGGPERAYQLGVEYRDPKFWWIGLTGNYFSNSYIDVNNLARTDNFVRDFDRQIFNDYNPLLARELLRQEEFASYALVNAVGGKSWRIGSYFLGFFATINNVLGQEYKTGGFEQGRTTNFRDIRDDISRENGRVFGPRYFFGNGTTYYLNLYVRF